MPDIIWLFNFDDCYNNFNSFYNCIFKNIKLEKSYNTSNFCTGKNMRDKRLYRGR